LEDLLKTDARLHEDVAALVGKLQQTAAAQGNTVMVFGDGGVAMGGGMSGGSITTHGSNSPASPIESGD
jgi:hypothetical protein